MRTRPSPAGSASALKNPGGNEPLSEEAKQIVAYLRVRLDEGERIMIRRGENEPDRELWRSRMEEVARDIEQGFHLP